VVYISNIRSAESYIGDERWVENASVRPWSLPLEEPKLKLAKM
jgi:hypothetical protein